MEREKNLTLHEESNPTPSDFALQCSLTELQ